MKKIKIRYGITHGGLFHADDVFSSALLKYIIPEIEISRVFKAPENYGSDTIVFDIGDGPFDHHQQEKEYRENGIPYASFGLLWREFGILLFPEEQVEKFDRDFVCPIDKADNTGCGDSLSRVISSFNPNWDMKDDTAFDKAVSFALEILKREFSRIEASLRAEKEVKEALNKMEANVVVLTRFVPWQNVLVPTDALYVVYPSLRGGYNIQCVPAPGGGSKKPLPGAWLENKPEGVGFVHTGLFLASVDKLDRAIELASSL